MPVDVFSSKLGMYTTPASHFAKGAAEKKLQQQHTLLQISDIHLTASGPDCLTTEDGQLNKKRAKQLTPFFKAVQQAEASSAEETIVLGGDILDILEAWPSTLDKAPDRLTREQEMAITLPIIQQIATRNRWFFEQLEAFIQRDPEHHHVIELEGNHDRWMAEPEEQQALLNTLHLNNNAKQAYRFEKSGYYHPTFKALFMHGHELDSMRQKKKHSKPTGDKVELVNTLLINHIGQAVLDNPLTKKGKKTDGSITKQNQDYKAFLDSVYFVRPFDKLNEYIPYHLKHFLRLGRSDLLLATYSTVNERLKTLEIAMQEAMTDSPSKKPGAFVSWFGLSKGITLLLERGYKRLTEKNYTSKGNKKNGIALGEALQNVLYAATVALAHQKVKAVQSIKKQIAQNQAFLENYHALEDVDYLITGHTHTPFRSSITLRKKEITLANGGGNERITTFRLKKIKKKKRNEKNEKHIALQKNEYPGGYLLFQKSAEDQAIDKARLSLHVTRLPSYIRFKNNKAIKQ